MPPRAKPKKPRKKKAVDVPAPDPIPPKKNSELTGYAESGGHRDRNAARERAKSTAGRDIGPPCMVRLNADRYWACKYSLKLYCETYLAGWFPLAWSEDHLKTLAKFEACILRGDRHARALPRGGGKTAMARAAIMWGISYGHRRYGVLVAATDELAKKNLLRPIKQAFETNELLHDDFPLICHPIVALDRITIRARGQTIYGESTNLQWDDHNISMPWVEGSICAGSIIISAGLTGSNLRGPSESLPDGTIIRPEVILLDDPSTDESAKSPKQNMDREDLILGTILGMAGPKKKIALMACVTCIAPGDLAERLLDRARNPMFQGECGKMLYEFPTNLQLWEKYREVRTIATLAGRGSAEANEFYLANREALDAGAVVGWKERFEDTDVSAVQTAMNKWIDSPRKFMAEFQNEPMSDDPSFNLVQLDPDEFCNKLTRVPRRMVPRSCQRLTCAIDVQQGVLFYMVVAWDEGFGGSIIDYGTFPKQNSAYFSAADARPNFETMAADPASPMFGIMPVDARIYRALRLLTDDLLSRSFEQHETKAQLRIERCLVDSGKWTDTVYQFCRESPHATILLPSKGYGITAAKVPVMEWPKKDGERPGWNWRMSAPERGRGRLVKIDTYPWKSFVLHRLLAPMASRGCLSVFGERAYDHQLLADHLTAEGRIRTTGRGRELEEWYCKPGKENHWWDTVVMAAVAASIQGLVWNPSGELIAPQLQKRKKKWSEIYNEKWGQKV